MSERRNDQSVRLAEPSEQRASDGLHLASQGRLIRRAAPQASFGAEAPEGSSSKPCHTRPVGPFLPMCQAAGSRQLSLDASVVTNGTVERKFISGTNKGGRIVLQITITEVFELAQPGVGDFSGTFSEQCKNILLKDLLLQHL
ncbi:hypothetical protein J4Q44_G00354160 [Coregonus suidteri]|uniref:Uncharacterized protein n=1 Tax=Coregonus suidteri TaxID=861788 RepID=A0AAN8KT72_9TELE